MKCLYEEEKTEAELKSEALLRTVHRRDATKRWLFLATMGALIYGIIRFLDQLALWLSKTAML